MHRLRLCVPALCRSYASRSRAPLLELKPCDLWPWDSASSVPTFTNIAWRLLPEEAWAVIGFDAGSLVNAALLGRARCDPPDARQWPFLRDRTVPPDQAIQRVRFLTGSASSGFSDWTARYGALRDEDRVTLGDHLRGKTQEEAHLQSTCAALSLLDLLDNPLITLSNGQTRRARIAAALLEKPEVLVLEDPNAGLDVQSRRSLDGHLRQLHESGDPHIVLTCRSQDGLPDWISSVVEVAPDRSIVYVGSRERWIPSNRQVQTHRKAARQDTVGEKIVKLDKVSISGVRPILSELSWTIRAGERWALKGSNGSGKSTTLGLITGDHPQSYSAPIELFGRPRNTYATSILQSKIGFVSPELNRAFPRSAGLTAREAIATGFESVYSYRRINAEQSAQLDKLVADFDFDEVLKPALLDAPFGDLTPARQALILFLRALVRSPPLLIFDEPFAGMDAQTIERCHRFIDHKLRPDQAVILVSHWEDEIPSTIDHVLRLEGGRVVEML